VAEVHTIHEERATPQQVLAQAYARAQSGAYADVVIVATKQDGSMDIGWASCAASDLAVAALYIEAEARKLLKME